jgi:ATP-dependent helicase/nuclease subunit A
LAEDTDAEIAPLFKFQSRAPKLQISVAPPFRKLSATEIGTAHHTFLQLVSLEKVSSAVGLREEARRLELAEQLSGEEAAQLDFVALAEFWQSDLGLQILAQSNNVRRELEFTARFSPQELSDALPPTLSPIGGEGGGERDSLIVRNQVQKEQETPKEQHGAKIQHTEPIVPEYVVVQGAADLVVLLPHEIWLVDFKTDRMTLTDKYAKVRQYEPQLRLYSLALSKIFQRPMTQAHLHFLALRLSVKIEPSSAASNK